MTSVAVLVVKGVDTCVECKATFSLPSCFTNSDDVKLNPGYLVFKRYDSLVREERYCVIRAYFHAALDSDSITDGDWGPLYGIIDHELCHTRHARAMEVDDVAQQLTLAKGAGPSRKRMFACYVRANVNKCITYTRCVHHVGSFK